MMGRLPLCRYHSARHLVLLWILSTCQGMSVKGPSFSCKGRLAVLRTDSWLYSLSRSHRRVIRHRQSLIVHQLPESTKHSQQPHTASVSECPDSQTCRYGQRQIIPWMFSPNWNMTRLLWNFQSKIYLYYLRRENPLICLAEHWQDSKINLPFSNWVITTMWKSIEQILLRNVTSHWFVQE